MQRVIIIGGGASGIACALKLKSLNPGLHITILEQNERIGKKILKTGNGRCNISNLQMKPVNYNHPGFVQECLERFTVADLLEFFRYLGLMIKSDNAYRLYPYSESATTVLDVFLENLRCSGIETECNQQVVGIKNTGLYEVTTPNNTYRAEIVVMATGSQAQENTNGYELLKSLNHSVTALRPGLVPLKVRENVRSLQGLRIKCRASVYDDGKCVHAEEGEILFKEQGLSGVLSLNLSRHAKKGSSISLDLLPISESRDAELMEIMRHKGIKQALLGVFPKMLAQEIIRRSSENMDSVIRNLHDFRFEVVGDYGFSTAQITLGGLDLSEINPDFSSKITHGLYIIGELLDIDGASGGYNLHFAWISGILAAQAICSEIEKK